MPLDDSVFRRSTALREMLGLARSILADGKVTEMEAKVFRSWIARNPEVLGVWPVPEISGILRNAFADGELSEEEADELRALLSDVAGDDRGLV